MDAPGASPSPRGKEDRASVPSARGCGTCSCGARAAGPGPGVPSAHRRESAASCEGGCRWASGRDGGDGLAPGRSRAAAASLGSAPAAMDSPRASPGAAAPAPSPAPAGGMSSRFTPGSTPACPSPSSSGGTMPCPSVKNSGKGGAMSFLPGGIPRMTPPLVRVAGRCPSGAESVSRSVPAAPAVAGPAGTPDKGRGWTKGRGGHARFAPSSAASGASAVSTRPISDGNALSPPSAAG